jgi:hypothetical protein
VAGRPSISATDAPPSALKLKALGPGSHGPLRGEQPLHKMNFSL